jgi:hypothetical protein
MTAPGTYTPPPTAGWAPLPITPVFSLGEDWIVTLAPSDSAFAWPTGATVTAGVYAPLAGRTPGVPPAYGAPLFSYDGQIQPDNSVYFKAESADCDQVPAGSIMRVMVALPNTPSSDDYCWAQGKVSRRDGT